MTESHRVGHAFRLLAGDPTTSRSVWLHDLRRHIISMNMTKNDRHLKNTEDDRF